MKLFDHQIDALNKTKYHDSCAYYLDMGLGKTFVGSEKMRILGKRFNVIVCQKSKISDWLSHIETYYDDYRAYDLTKPKKLKEFMSLQDPKSFLDPYCHVGIINYELIWRRKEFLKMNNFTLMLDESSLIANEESNRSKFILAMKPTNVILLSGTPVAGKYELLWSQCKLLGWNISKSAFWTSYVVTRLIDMCGFMRHIVVGYKNVDHLKSKLSEYGAIFMKTDEVMSLPDQIEQNIMMPASKEYKYFKKNSYVMIDDKEFVGDNSLTKMLYERMLCGIYNKEKVQAFKDILNSTNDRLVVFYNFNVELEVLQAACSDRPQSVVNGKNRDLSAYENHENSVTFVQYQAGAMGLNLQLSNKIIYFTLPLGKGSCDLWEQSKKRIHRIGQRKTCFYYYLLVSNSIEQWNLSLLKEGKELTDALFQNKRN